MRNTISALILIAMMSPLQAKTFTCIGMDSAQKTWKIIGDSKTDKFIINGEIYSLDGTKENKSKLYVVFTENFITSTGKYVYNVIGRHKENNEWKWFMLQRNAATNEIIAGIDLSCSLD